MHCFMSSPWCLCQKVFSICDWCKTISSTSFVAPVTMLLELAFRNRCKYINLNAIKVKLNAYQLIGSANVSVNFVDDLFTFYILFIRLMLDKVALFISEFTFLENIFVIISKCKFFVLDDDSWSLFS
jgi:hypothetical protein